MDRQPSAAFDLQVRQFIYDRLMKGNRPPLIAETAAALESPASAVGAAYGRLAEAHVLVLQADGEILMAFPFSAVPTPFQVQAGEHRWWSNCIWDALGIIALLKQNGQIFTACGDCNEAMFVTVKDQTLVEPQGVIHFALPVREWWQNVVYT